MGAHNMFDDERREFEILFNFYKKKFKEEIYYIPGVYCDRDFEVNLLMGYNSEDLLGARILQYPIHKHDEYEDDIQELIQYDFVKTSEKNSSIEGQPYFQFFLDSGYRDPKIEPKLKLSFIIYAIPLGVSYKGDFVDAPSKMVKLTGVMIIKGNDASAKLVFLADTDLHE
ncbi:MAG: hypothetical protein ACTSRK_03375 [Promethearchaeota archaeon]